MKEAEKQFRGAERRLDELLCRDEAIIAARDVTITDDSARAYHYKNEYLSWRYRFESRRARGSEVEKVWVVVSLEEGDVATLRVWRRAEIFQVGQSSRWQSTAEGVRPLEDAIRDGLSSIVLEAIRAGEAEAAEAA